MSSWTTASSQRKGVQILPYYHQSGFASFAQEFFDLCISVTYAQDTRTFLFVFDMINSVSTEFLLFQNTLKKNMFVRYLSYFPSSGFNLKERPDLTHPIAERRPLPDKDHIFDLAPQLFQVQEKVHEITSKFFQRHELGQRDYSGIVCISPDNEDPMPYLEKLQSLPRDSSVCLYIVAPSLEVFQRFQKAFPSVWSLESIHTTGDLQTVTLEQKIRRFYLEVGEFQRLHTAQFVVGSYRDVRCRLLGLLQKRFREQFGDFRSIDGKFFSIFSDS